MNIVCGIRRGGGKTLSYLSFAFVTIAAMAVAQSSWAASGFWKGTGLNSGDAENWTNNKPLLDNDNSYIRDSRMNSDATYRRAMVLTANATQNKHVFFQAGTESDPFVVTGNDHTLQFDILYVGGSVNTDGETYVGSAVLDGGVYKPNYFAVGGIYNGNFCTGYLKLTNGAKIATQSGSYNYLYNGKIVSDNCDVTLASRLYLGKVIGGHSEYYHLGGNLVVEAYIAVGFFDPSDGNGFAYMEVDGGLVTNKTQTIIVGDNGALGDQAILNVKSGIVAANQNLYVGNGASGTILMNGGELDVSRGTINFCSGSSCTSGEDCSLVLSDGVVKAQTITYGSGSANATLLFDGGTLRAVMDGTLIQSKPRLTVSVGAGGGTIDTGDHAITIAENLDGTGCMTFTGGGTATITGDINYLGKTFVAPGTKLKVATKAKATNVLSHGLEPAAGLEIGESCTILTSDVALTGIDLADVSCDGVHECVVELVDEDRSVKVTKLAGLKPTYYVGPTNGNLSVDSNWSDGIVPTSGNCFIGTMTAAHLAVGDTFSPSSITFTAGSAPVTIVGDLDNITVITNRSYANQTFAGQVSFGEGNVNVVQTGAYADGQTVTGGCVVFAGGVTGKDVANHSIFTGDYTLTKADVFNFKTSGNARAVINTNSTLYVQSTDQIHELYIMSGATFHVANASHGWSGTYGGASQRLWYRSEGTFVADSYALTGNGQMWLGGLITSAANADANSNAVLKIGTVTVGSNGQIWFHGYGNSGDALTTYIGEGGINIASGKKGYFGVVDSSHNSTLRPWNSDITISGGANTDYDFRIGNGSDKGDIKVNLHTDDEDGVAREVTLAARVKTEMDTSSITVMGSGTLRVTTASPLMTGSTIVTNSATLAFAAGVSFGASGTAGAITLCEGTTLALTATSSQFAPLVNTLNLPTGENETAILRIDGAGLSTGDHVIFSSVGSGTAENLTLDMASTSLGGRKRASLRLEGGQLVLGIPPLGLTIIVN